MCVCIIQLEGSRVRCRCRRDALSCLSRHLRLPHTQQPRSNRMLHQTQVCLDMRHSTTAVPSVQISFLSAVHRWRRALRRHRRRRSLSEDRLVYLLCCCNAVVYLRSNSKTYVQKTRHEKVVLRLHPTHAHIPKNSLGGLTDLVDNHEVLAQRQRLRGDVKALPRRGEVSVGHGQPVARPSSRPQSVARGLRANRFSHHRRHHGDDRRGRDERGGGAAQEVLMYPAACEHRWSPRLQAATCYSVGCVGVTHLGLHTAVCFQQPWRKDHTIDIVRVVGPPYG